MSKKASVAMATITNEKSKQTGGSIVSHDSSSDGSGSSDGDDCCQAECCQTVHAKRFRSNLLLFLLLLGLVAAVGIGAAIRTVEPPFNDRQLMYFRFPGDVFMRMLKCLIIPLVVTSIISGLSGLDSRASGKMGGYAVAYYMCTTLVAVLLGIMMVMTIKPGVGAQDVESEGNTEPTNIADTFLDLIRNIFPDNIVEACFIQTRTKQIEMVDEVNATVLVNGTECNYTAEDSCEVIQIQNHTWYDFEIAKENGMNILGLVTFSIAMGIVTNQLGETGRPIYQFTFAIAEASMKLVTAVIWISPIGIMFLVSAEIIGMEDPQAEFRALGMYIATVVSGLLIHGFVILPIIYAMFVKKNPYKFMWGASQAMITALGTSSSSATLPVTYKCLEENNHVDSRVTRFVLPVGATINMDGTALYEAVAAIYIAQTLGMDLSPADIIIISITATMASIGAASVPQAGLITLMVVLTAVGIPADEVSKILAVDWLLDRVRTMVNVEGDSFGAGVVEHFSRHALAAIDEADRTSSLSGGRHQAGFRGSIDSRESRGSRGSRGSQRSRRSRKSLDHYPSATKAQQLNDPHYTHGYVNGGFQGDQPGGVTPWVGSDPGWGAPHGHVPGVAQESESISL